MTAPKHQRDANIDQSSTLEYLRPIHQARHNIPKIRAMLINYSNAHHPV